MQDSFFMIYSNQKCADGMIKAEIINELKIKHNELTARQFIELWESVWEGALTLEQTELAMKHTLFRVSVWDVDFMRFIQLSKYSTLFVNHPPHPQMYLPNEHVRLCWVFGQSAQFLLRFYYF